MDGLRDRASLALWVGKITEAALEGVYPECLDQLVFFLAIPRRG